MEGGVEVGEGDGANGDIDAFERFEAPDDEGGGHVGQGEVAAGGGAVAGMEALQVNATGDDADAIGMGAVELGEEVAFVGCGADEAVAALDDAAFQTLLKGTQSASNDVRGAAFAALGSAGLTDDQTVAVAGSARPTAADSE